MNEKTIDHYTAQLQQANMSLGITPNKTEEAKIRALEAAFVLMGAPSTKQASQEARLYAGMGELDSWIECIH